MRPLILLPLAACLSTSSAAAQNLVHHFRLNETSGVAVSDSSPNGLHGTIVGNNSFWTQGQLGGGLDLGGTGTHVRVASDPVQDLAQLTVTAWVNVEVLGDWDGVLTKGQNTSPYALQLGWPIGKFKFTINWGNPAGSVGGGTYTSVSDLTPGQWHHLAATFDGNELKLYLDGALDVTHATPGVVIGTAQEILTLGADFPGGDEYFDGVLDDVRLYDGPLSQAAIQALMGGAIGTRYCTPNVANTTGLSGMLEVVGSPLVIDNFVNLTASDLPANQFGIFIVAPTPSFIPGPGGAQGNLCLGGGIGRYNSPAQLGNSGATGVFSLALDLTATPSPTGPFAATAGQSLYFQAWYRDFITGQGATSNFTDAVQVDFL